MTEPRNRVPVVPTLIEVIKDLACLGELEGAEGQIKADGRMTPDVQAEIARKRVDLMRRQPKK